MTDESSDLDTRFARLAAATEGVRARPDFPERVMQAIAADEAPVATAPPPGWVAGVLVASRVALGAAALAALIAVSVAVLQDRQSNDAPQTLLTYDTMEVGW